MNHIEIESTLKQALANLEKDHKEFYDKHKLDRIQGNNRAFSYHVEEHMYM